MTFLAIIDQ